MENRTYWVLIETNEDRFDNPDKPTREEIDDILRNSGNYGIVDYVPESDIEDIQLKPGK